jgi:hypothetical protein
VAWRGLAIAIALFAAPKAAEPAPLPVPPLVLTVTPGASGGPWKLKIENVGEVPIRITADPRLLELDITPPGDKAKPVRCALPDDARPANDEGRELVIPGKRSWTANVDPIFLCFGGRERGALVSGASVKATFGWRSNAKKPAPPFAAAPVGAAIGVFGPAKTVESNAFTLSDTVPAVPSSTSSSNETPASSSLSLSMPEALDIGRGSEIQTTITATNESDRSITLLFRPEVVAFRVTGPGGSITCGSPRSVDAPIRELFSTIAAKARASQALLLTAMCPADTFDDPGVYRVFPLLDTRGASGRTIGLRTWDAKAEGTKPMLLRVRSERRPQPPPRPSLDEKS